MTTPIRNRDGWLTKIALRAGYSEQKAWVDVGMRRHTVVLALQPSSGEEMWRVDHKILTADGELVNLEHRVFSTIVEARLAFDSHKAGTETR